MIFQLVGSDNVIRMYKNNIGLKPSTTSLQHLIFSNNNTTQLSRNVHAMFF